ncbi:hypothetical protein GGX14DRAFT_701925 [Mycena pura]|uniref:DUF6534 domain-containing protein n=1 Tax=Mycena pura TaxID=153505 RepID=A0AAD6UTB9_9AGAR|nr:hypothetical protein GGX14DRAFT_701925 [Mycena pura]
MSAPSLDIITGAILIGTWAASLLYAAEVMQAVYYFSHFKNDAWTKKVLVGFTVLIDTVSILGDYGGVYLYTITHAGDLVYLSNQNWSAPLHLFTTAVVVIVVQLFLIVRYWRFTKNIPATLFLVLLTMAAFGSSVACGVIIAMFPAFKDRDKVKIPATIWLVTEAVADLGIAAALLWEFRRVNMRETWSVVRRLMTVTIQTGTASALIATAALIAFLTKEESNGSAPPPLKVPVGIAYTLGRVYVITMLSNLNIRTTTNERRVVNLNKTTKTTSSSSGPSHGTRDGSGGSIVFAQGRDTELSGIHVHRTAVVSMDNQHESPTETFKSAPGQLFQSEALRQWEQEMTVKLVGLFVE